LTCAPKPSPSGAKATKNAACKSPRALPTSLRRTLPGAGDGSHDFQSHTPFPVLRAN
jgi:hypothetical protein